MTGGFGGYSPRSPVAGRVFRSPSPVPVKIFCGNSNPLLAQAICDSMQVPLGKCTVSTFPDGETFVKIEENVRGEDVFIIQSTSAPANQHWMELFIMMDALRRASATRITAVLPFFGYARQDRKDQPRVPITAKLVANLLTVAGANRILTIDLHADQIQGFFDIPVDHLYAMPVFIEYLRNRGLTREETVVISPDAGGVERARAFAKRIESTMAIIDKRRPQPNVSEVMNIIGDVKGKHAVIIDDMIDTAGTVTQAAKVILDRGAKSVLACVTHGVLSGPAIQRINDSVLSDVIITDTIPLSAAARACSKIQVLSVAKLLAESIKRIHHGDSISSLFV